LSCISEAINSHGILISPSRQNVTLALQQYNDEWLKLNSGLGNVSSLSSRVKLFYPPSPAHLCLLLSMFVVPTSGEADTAAWLNTKTTLATPPSLVILHELSAYFLSNDRLSSSKWTLSSYLSLITHAFSSLTFLSGAGQARSGSVSFALFDSRIDQLRLPMLKQPTHCRDDNENRPIPRLEPVYNFAQKYFEWIIVADQEEPSVHGTRRRRTMVLHRNGSNSNPIKSWEWWEGHDVENPDERQATRLCWQC